MPPHQRMGPYDICSLRSASVGPILVSRTLTALACKTNLQWRFILLRQSRLDNIYHTDPSSDAAASIYFTVFIIFVKKYSLLGVSD